MWLHATYLPTYQPINQSISFWLIRFVNHRRSSACLQVFCPSYQLSPLSLLISHYESFTSASYFRLRLDSFVLSSSSSALTAPSYTGASPVAYYYRFLLFLFDPRRFIRLWLMTSCSSLSLPLFHLALSVNLHCIALKAAFHWVRAHIVHRFAADVQVSKHEYIHIHIHIVFVRNTYNSVSRSVRNVIHMKHIAQTKLLVSQGSWVLACISAHRFFLGWTCAVAHVCFSSWQRMRASMTGSGQKMLHTQNRIIEN